MFGFLNIDKPSGMTSHSVISSLRKITGVKQIGHAGTLDPLASGVLPVAIGKASKLIDYLDEEKEYIAGIYLGKISDTYDIQGNVSDFSTKKITKEQIEEVIPEFLGEIKQIPPAFSAVHYNGKRLYELARAGKIPDDIPQRKVYIYKNEIISFDYEKQSLCLKIACSKGTYIRSIVNDLGQMLASGGVMYKLIRTKSSGFNIENSLKLTDQLSIEEIKNSFINPIAVLNMDKYEINEEEYLKLKHGNKFKNRRNSKDNILLIKNDKILAIATCDEEYIQPKKVLL